MLFYDIENAMGLHSRHDIHNLFAGSLGKKAFLGILYFAAGAGDDAPVDAAVMVQQLPASKPRVMMHKSWLPELTIGWKI